jgi:hypothetical protein
MDLVSILRGLRCYRLRATDLEHNKLLKTNILSCLHQNVKILIRLLSSMTTKSIFYYYSRIKYFLDDLKTQQYKRDVCIERKWKFSLDPSNIGLLLS